MNARFRKFWEALAQFYFVSLIGWILLFYRCCLVVFLIVGVGKSTLDIGEKLWSTTKGKRVRHHEIPPSMDVNQPTKQQKKDEMGNSAEVSSVRNASVASEARRSNTGSAIPETLHMIELLMVSLLPLYLIKAISLYLSPLPQNSASFQSADMVGRDEAVANVKKTLIATLASIFAIHLVGSVVQGRGEVDWRQMLAGAGLLVALGILYRSFSFERGKSDGAARPESSDSIM